ncbi:hypothetical protein GQ607_013847 [Colletotrichum asianum]|uniref:Uncharacterized protein n=1 Tax=Colletotrichum asianum TaxID=702518 RepID=A0A8H3W633_9PEZI|nr:hypothetical protein GQ607_013847 [Colletotrichum asianum]
MPPHRRSRNCNKRVRPIDTTSLRHLRRCRQLQPSNPSWQTRQDRSRECSPKPSPTKNPSQPSKTPVHRQADRRLSRRRNSKHTPPKGKRLVVCDSGARASASGEAAAEEGRRTDEKKTRKCNRRTVPKLKIRFARRGLAITAGNALTRRFFWLTMELRRESPLTPSRRSPK